MEDRLLTGLKLAETYWKQSNKADKDVKLAMAVTLSQYEMFSLNQLGKIVGLTPRELSGKIEPNASGGRFEPEAIGVLIKLREHKLKGQKASVTLVEMAMEAETSLSCIVGFTGIPYGTYYRAVKGD